MYRKVVWCYVFVLTLLDISLNTKLSAQGKSHGVTVHDSLIEGITFQEWGKESDGDGRGGRAVAAGALQLSPPALEFGRAALASAHALSVTLTNTANTTMHLASVAGTTPDFHASFFESKTLPPQANTTFSVVYLGRREGPVAAHLYIHTSLGVHKYPVSAEGVASEYGLWPLVGVRVPLNATVEPLLTLHNPTDHPIQVSEVYSSGAWLGLALPGGGESAPRAAWSIPARASRPLVRLRLAPPPPHAAHPHPLTAYVRIKANITGGGLVVCVEARSVPAGEFVSPLQLRLRTRGSRDPPDVLDIAAGNSAGSGVALEASVWAARCAATPPAPPPPPDLAPPTANGQTDKGTANGNGMKSEGVYVSLLEPHLVPHQNLIRTAQMTLDYAKMWASHVGGGGGGAGGGGGGGSGAWCAGWLRLGRAALPYSLRLLPGTLRLTPPDLHFITSNQEDSERVREVRVRNEFPLTVQVSRIDFGPDVETYFEVMSATPVLVGAGGAAGVAHVRLRPDAPRTALRSHLLLRTNLTDYTLPLLAYSGELRIEWEWPHSADGSLRLGALGTSSTRRVGALLHNPAPAALCVRELVADLAGATLALEACAHLRDPPPDHTCRCIPAGGAARAQLTVVAPARAGALRGAVRLRAAGPAHARPADTRAPVSLAAHAGRLHALPLQLLRAAPYAWASVPLVLESSMQLPMRVVSVTLPASDPAVMFEPAPEPQAREVRAGRRAVGSVLYAAERACRPRCYTGLDVRDTEGAAWLRRGAGAGALRADAALQRARHALWAASPAAHNFTLHVHTSAVLQLPARGLAAAWWPRLAPARALAGLAGVGAAAALRVRARNPSRSHALLLQPVLVGAPLALAAEAAGCGAEPCRWAREAFALLDWRAERGAVRAWPGAPPAADHALPMLLLPPDSEIEIKLNFTPQEPVTLSAYLYLRNNLTIMEGVLLTGRGAFPSFELGGRRPGSNAPLLFEVSECDAGEAAGAAGTVRRTVVARNTGAVTVRLRDWRLAGQPCQARGFRLSPCAPLALAPNESRALTLAFTPDYTLARVACPLSARTDTGRATFALHAAAPARLLPRCAAAAPRPPWEPAARAAAALLALAALALVLAAAALDAERELRRARAARPPPPPAARQPLDLRALAQPAAPAPAPAPTAPPRRPAPRRRRPPRRDAPPLDPQAERRAFERWRAEVLRQADEDDSRSSEDADREDHVRRPPSPTNISDEIPLLDSEAHEVPHEEPLTITDGYEADPEIEDRPGSGDEDAASTESGSASVSSSSPTVDDRDEADEPEEEPSRESPAPAAGDSPLSPGADFASPGRSVRARAVRGRREAASPARRGERAQPRSPRPRALPGRAPRRDKAGKRRERAPLSPPRPSPARAPAALRWGASWSSVVARGPAGAALAPIGSDVRRRAEPAPAPAADHSLFYFNGDSSLAHRDADFSWRPPPPVERAAFTPARDFLDEPESSVGGPGAVGSGAFRSVSSVWGAALEPRPAAAAWLWGGYAEPAASPGPVRPPPGPVRPPPGFGAPPRPVRPYDPFRSLASIWAPGALDWRSELAADEPGPAGPGPVKPGAQPPPS